MRLLVLILIVLTLMGCVQTQNKSNTFITKKKVPLAIIFGKTIYGKRWIVVINTSKTYLPLNNHSVSKLLWPSFTMEILCQGAKREFQREIIINATNPISKIYIYGGKILGSDVFNDISLSINIAGNNINEKAKIYYEKGKPTAFNWRSGYLKLEQGVYKLVISVRGTPRIANPNLKILFDVQFSLTQSFEQNESIVRHTRIDNKTIFYRIIGTIGTDEAWRVVKGVVGGFVQTSRFRDALVMKLNATKVVWAKTWDIGGDEWVWDVSEGKNFVCAAVLTQTNGEILKIGSDGNLIWAKSVKLEGLFTSLTAINCSRDILIGGNFLAEISRDGSKVLWCKCPLHFVTHIQVFNGNIYVIDEDRLLKLDSNGKVLWAKVAVKGRNYVKLKDISVCASGIYAVGWFNFSTVVMKFDHNGNIQWAKLVLRNSIPSGITIKKGSIYIVGSLPKKEGFIAVMRDSKKISIIIVNNSELRDISANKSIYCVGSSFGNVSFDIKYCTAINLNIKTRSVNINLTDCKLELGNAEGNFSDFSIGRGLNNNILIVNID